MNERGEIPGEEAPGPIIAGRKITAARVLRRMMLLARGLGFVFLVFFLPEMIREITHLWVPGGGFRAGFFRGVGFLRVVFFLAVLLLRVIAQMFLLGRL